MMDKQVKKLWIKALTSGEYKQGTRQLRNGNKFCCLGVLCDVYRREIGGRWQGVKAGKAEFCGETTVLPDKVIQWAKVGSYNPIVKRGTTTLAAENDYSDIGFPGIAKLIERYL